MQTQRNNREVFFLFSLFYLHTILRWISSKAFGQERVLKYAPPPAAEMGANLHRKRAHLHLTKDTIAPNVPVLTLDIGATGIRALM